MDALTLPEQALTESAPARTSDAAPAAVVTWSLATRILFRMSVAYFGVYVLFTQMLVQ